MSARIDPADPRESVKGGGPRTRPILVCKVCPRTFVRIPGRHLRYCSRACCHFGKRRHSLSEINAARVMWIAGQPVRAIAEALGITRNAVIGIAHRNEGFPPRPSPIRRTVNAGLST